MTDYRKIRVSPKFSKLRSIDVAAINRRLVTWLDTELKLAAQEKTVVLTHHAPSSKSLPASKKLEMSSAAYASELEYLINEYSPAIWIHGHIHMSSDYYVGSTRVICNPRGYPDERNTEFSSIFTVNI